MAYGGAGVLLADKVRKPKIDESASPRRQGDERLYRDSFRHSEHQALALAARLT